MNERNHRKRKRSITNREKSKGEKTDNSDIIGRLDNLKRNTSEANGIKGVQPTKVPPALLLGLVLVISLVGVGVLSLNSGDGDFLPNLGNDVSSPLTYTEACVDHGSDLYHIHQSLYILVNGESQVIPSNIGVKPGCMRAIHTHESGGTIHVEVPEGLALPEPTLGVFFDVWDTTSPESRVWDYTGNVTLTVNNQPYNQDYRSLVLEDDQVIIIEVVTT